MKRKRGKKREHQSSRDDRGRGNLQGLPRQHVRRSRLSPDLRRMPEHRRGAQRRLPPHAMRTVRSHSRTREIVPELVPIMSIQITQGRICSRCRAGLPLGPTTRRMCRDCGNALSAKVSRGPRCSKVGIDPETKKPLRHYTLVVAMGRGSGVFCGKCWGDR